MGSKADLPQFPVLKLVRHKDNSFSWGGTYRLVSSVAAFLTQCSLVRVCEVPMPAEEVCLFNT